MSTMQAFRDGARRGTLMAANPRAAFDQHRRKSAAGPDAMTKAWESVGRSLRTAMNAEKQARRRCGASRADA